MHKVLKEILVSLVLFLSASSWLNSREIMTAYFTTFAKLFRKKQRYCKVTQRIKVLPIMLWNNRHLERSQSEVERSITICLQDVITVAIDISTTFPFVTQGNSAQYDVILN
ncbi:MAG: hypothetical protein KAG37_08395 [Flavobacteriales bacterium]|nr:hypothetical protein [Flavobacteriales bacterium]